MDRYKEIADFQSEDFWYIAVSVKRGTHTPSPLGKIAQVLAHKVDSAVATFNWARKHLFDRLAVLTLYEICMENPRALIASVKQKEIPK